VTGGGIAYAGILGSFGLCDTPSAGGATRVDALAEFARHLNVAASIVRARSPSLASRLICYEALINDAVDEVDGGWLEEVLRKKHVTDILALLGGKPGGDFAAELLRKQTGLEPANLSRRLGLMESAGLIEKRYEGPHLLVQATALGLQSLKPEPGAEGTIQRVGFADRGAFIDRADAASSCVLERSSGNLVLSERAFPGLESPIAKDRIRRFGLYPLDKAGEAFNIYVDVDDKGGTTRILLGVWRTREAYQEVLDWVENANAQIQRLTIAKAPPASFEKVLHRIVAREQLRYVPGKSMSSAAGIARMEEYDRPWMHNVVSCIVGGIARTHPDSKAIAPKFQKWPERETWDRIFDRILAPDVHRRAPSQALDLCFEFLYRDPMRVGRYDIVRIGDLSTFTLVYRAENSRIDLISEAIKRDCAKLDRDARASALIWPYDSFERTLQDMAVVPEREKVDRPDPWKIYAVVGTVSNNMLQGLANLGVVADDDVQEVKNNELCVESFRDDAKLKGTVAFCDTVIANDLLALWKQSGGNPTRLKTQLVHYSLPVSVGIGVPLGDPDWKATVHAALLEMVHRGDEDARRSWAETLHELSEIGVRVDLDFVQQRQGRKVEA